MPRTGLLKSVVTRLVAALVIGGFLIAAALSALELQRAEPALRLETTQQVAQTARNIQSVLRGTLDARSPQQIREVLEVFIRDPRFAGVRLSRRGHEPIELGGWPAAPDPNLPTWELTEHALTTGREISLSERTVVEAPFIHQGKVVELKLLIDGPAARSAMRRQLAQNLTTQALLLAVMTLLGLLLLRRWFAGPLEEIVALVSANAGPEPFYNLARHQMGEFAVLTEAIAGMLTRLDCTTQRLRVREQTLANLYQFAPAAMVSLDRAGKIIEANRKAATLLRVGAERSLLDLDVSDFLAASDRPLLRQAIDRLDLDAATRCELRLQVEGGPIDALVECTAVRDDNGVLQHVRLSLQDVTQAKQLQRQLVDQSRLLNLVINHMSDAILLVDARRIIAAHNQKLVTLVQPRRGALVGQRYNPREFWDALGVHDREAFESRLAQIEADTGPGAQQRFDTRVGPLLFHGIPVHDAGGELVGRLWVIQETSGQDQSQQVLARQKEQLQTLRRLGLKISEAADVDGLMQIVAQNLYDSLGVEAMGIALRRDDSPGRSRQLLHRGSGLCRYDTAAKLVDAVARKLMPVVLGQQEVMFWPDLPRDPWAKAFEQAGLTSVAAVPLQRTGDAQGILWIAQRGGEKLEPHHVFLLEAAGPLIAAQVEIAALRQRMNVLELTDPVTGLPNHRHFRMLVQRYTARPGSELSVLMLNLDQFRTLNDALEHQGGDMLLKTVAALLRRSSRKTTFIARLPGATFALLCPDLGREAARGLAQRLRELIGQQQVALPDAKPWSLTASVGLASCPEDGASAAQITDRAAARLELAKRTGRDRLVCEGDTTDRLAG